MVVKNTADGVNNIFLAVVYLEHYVVKPRSNRIFYCFLVKPTVLWCIDSALVSAEYATLHGVLTFCWQIYPKT